VVKADAFNAFLRRNLALRQVFTADQMSAMQNLAADF
jgi:hypothetical protein